MVDAVQDNKQPTRREKMNEFNGRYYPDECENHNNTVAACAAIMSEAPTECSEDCSDCGLYYYDEEFKQYKEFMKTKEEPTTRGKVITTKLTPFTAVKDSGKREEFATGSRRDSREGKGRYDLIPPYSLKRLAVHYENGAVKYGDNNWKKGQPLGRYLDSAMRHIQNTLDGQTDEDHAVAVAWNIFAFMWTANEIEEGRLPAELDDKNLTSKGVAE